jgi:diguanylate cyclase (GGDEF)-like protein
LNKGDFIALINPGMALIFACAFAILWHNQRERRYVKLLVGGFLALGAAFFLQYFSLLGQVVSRLASNTLFLVGGISLVVGALERYGRSPPYRPVIAIAAGGMLGFFFFYFIRPDLNWRILVMNFALGGIALIFAAELRAVPDKKTIDRFLLGVITVWGLSFFPRPLLAIWFDGPYDGYSDFHQSLYWMTLVFTGSLFMLLFSLTMITAIALDVMAELRERSETDSLSGLLNRRGFESGVATAFAVREAGAPATLIVCDIDRFKSINDRYGHAAGDRVIEHFAECLRGATEGQHLVGRVGGEEFALLLENADAITARLLAEGVRIAFSTATALGFPSGVHLTASFGIAEVSTGESLDDLFRRADQALYLAKNSGRDCVRVSPGPARTPSARQGTKLLATPH